MNVLKLFHSVEPITFNNIYQAIHNIEIEEYSEARNIFELLEFFSKNETA